MSELDDEELIATRRLNGVDDNLYEEEKKAIERMKQVLAKNVHTFVNELEIVLNLIEKLQKENEELKTELERQKDINIIINQKGLEKNYEKALEKTMTKFLKNNIDKDVIPVQRIKEKIEEEKLPLTIVGGRRNRKTLEYGIKLGRRQVLQELIEGKK